MCILKLSLKRLDVVPFVAQNSCALQPPKHGSEDEKTIIIDHFEDLMHFSDAPVMIRSLARELYAMDDLFIESRYV